MSTLKYCFHYSDVIRSAMVSQITGVSIIYSTACLGADQKRHRSFALLAFVRVNSPHKGPVTRKLFLFNDVIMWLISFTVPQHEI